MNEPAIRSKPRYSNPRYFEDFVVGAVYEFGEITVTEPEIISFARQFDPQAMHTDPAAAAKGPTNGLIASGWHTIGLMMRMYAKSASEPSWRAASVRW